ncbi:WD40 repeat domain-containing protein [Urbifossiella limnaea]|uniref:WD40 repeat domain-containing protein n=1 Tax=Urbifossiella limnaea TaxID=2528023 RepID=A0A517XXD1_9BACT|nr:hypothetical protein [Urbifossiella limnaea]QDU22177.1 hypothetical protein ETAA1_41530 [Urbifossiella limnaea]
MPRYDEDDEDADRPRRRRRRDDDDHDPFRPRKKRGGGPPIGLIVGGGVAGVLLLVGGIVLALTMRKAGPLEAKGGPAPAPAPAPEVRPVPFPVPGPAAGVEAKKPLFGVSLPAGTEGVRQIAFGGGPDGYVGLVGSAGLTADQNLTVARAKTGELVGRVLLPNGESVNGVAISTSARYAAVHVSAPFDGDVVVLHELASKQSYRFTPYSKKGAITNPGLVFVGFVGPDRLLTAHETSGFDVWQLPKMTRVCGQPGRPPSSMPMVEREGFSMRAKNAALSADGKTLALFDGTGFAFHDTTTAARTARTEAFVQGLTAGFRGAAFAPDGKRFAAITTTYSPQPLTALAVWDVAKGARLSTAPLRPGAGGTAMAFWGPDHVLLSQGGLGSAEVMAVATGEIVVKVETKVTGSSRLVSPDTPGGALWYAFDRSFGGREPSALGSVPAPAAMPGRTLELTPDGPQWR